ncbi:MAG: dTDP-4-dehydrorhamnose 3,5-epimerase [Gaiellaceae bacterium]
MIFTETDLAGAFVIDIERHEDERGFFARAWCEDELAEHGLSTRVVQCNIAYNHRRSTLRGMHFQAAPHAEVKLVRCTRGAIYDVIIDLRPESRTFRQWLAFELTAENSRMLYIPEGFAHGYETLADETETYYQMSETHTPEAARGVRWNDPAFGIAWPEPEPAVISEKDRSWPAFAWS